MEDITLFLWIGAISVLILQYYVHVSPIYFLGELLGVGGLTVTLQEVEDLTLSEDVGLVMTIAMIIVILYSTVNLIDHYWPIKGGLRQ